MKILGLRVADGKYDVANEDFEHISELMINDEGKLVFVTVYRKADLNDWASAYIVLY